MKKILAVLLLLSIFAVMLTSCGPPGSDDPEPDPGPSGSDASWEDLYAKGVQLMIDGKVDEANEYFKEATECEDAAMKCFGALADSYMILGKELEAEQALAQTNNTDYRSYRADWGFSFLDTPESCLVTGAYFDEDAYSTGKVTRYAVSVAYCCPSGKTCTLVCGANEDHPGYFSILDEKQVSGSGVVQFFLDTSQAKGAGDMFGFYAALYDNSQSGTWIPYPSGEPYHPAETDQVIGSTVTEDEISDLVQLMNGKDVSIGIGNMLLSDPSTLSRFAENTKGDEAPLMLALASVATWMISGGEATPNKTPILNVGDWPDDDEFYLDMMDEGLMTKDEANKAHQGYFTQFVSLDWVQLFFDKLYGKGVIDVDSWDYSGTVKTASGYVGMQPFGMETAEYYTFTYKGFESTETGGVLHYTCLRTEVDFDGNTTYYDGNSSTPISDKNKLFVRDAYVTKDWRGVHFTPLGASVNEVFWVSTTSGLRLRKGPGTDYDTVKILPYRTPVFLYEVNNGWGRVSRDQDGWMSLEYLEDLVTDLQ